MPLNPVRIYQPTDPGEFAPSAVNPPPAGGFSASAPSAANPGDFGVGAVTAVGAGSFTRQARRPRFPGAFGGNFPAPVVPVNAVRADGNVVQADGDHVLAD